MKNSPKLAILQSLDVMDQVQMEHLLVYIREVLHRRAPMDHKNFKKEAMKEIRQALKQNRRAENFQLSA